MQAGLPPWKTHAGRSVSKPCFTCLSPRHSLRIQDRTNKLTLCPGLCAMPFPSVTGSLQGSLKASLETALYDMSVTGPCHSRPVDVAALPELAQARQSDSLGTGCSLALCVSSIRTCVQVRGSMRTLTLGLRAHDLTEQSSCKHIQTSHASTQTINLLQTGKC